MELVVACTSPTRASASSVSTQSDTPLAIAGRALRAKPPIAAAIAPSPWPGWSEAGEVGARLTNRGVVGTLCSVGPFVPFPW
jgi:hypothetical protein